MSKRTSIRLSVAIGVLGVALAGPMATTTQAARVPTAEAIGAPAPLDAPSGPTELLPDLRPLPPDDLQVAGDAARFVIGFGSDAQNIGAAALKMLGHRPDTTTPQMRADQVVRLSNGGKRIYKGAGSFVYVIRQTHQHWHWLGFMRYELRRASTYAMVRPDVKSGFCVADRKRVKGYKTKSYFPDPTWCEYENPDATQLAVGLSVGWGDPYDPLREGQEIEVSGVPQGDYYIVHRVNPKRTIRESNYANNYSASLVHLSWPNGQSEAPRLTELLRCSRTGTPGRDVLVQRGRTVRLCGLSGHDRLVLLVPGQGTALGGPGADTFVAKLTRVTFDGGRGQDLVDYSRVKVGMVIDLQDGTMRAANSGNKLVSIERAKGGTGGDVIRGTAGSNRLFGSSGPDTLIGRAGPDRLVGGPGDDRLIGGKDSDILLGGSGRDRILSRDGVRDTIACGKGFDVVIADRVDRVAKDCERVVKA